ncbi:MAG TPA: Asp-tRNA(Asn)/Glu-tRNA(Gln) amidotransferase subunit GatC [Candidatus Polarisedimenticolia bacterium]|jgi:aspartyl-tRNA(Asn)/glutamyl-tRNA(Gln) amidotransferase subunit C
MKITLEEVRRIAGLAHIQSSDAGDEELELMRGQLDQVLAFVDKLNALDTRGVEPAIGVAEGMTGPLREDVPGATLAEEEALSNAPESGRGHFKVPRVIT